MWSFELRASEVEMREFRMKRQERTEIDKHVTNDEESGAFFV